MSQRPWQRTFDRLASLGRLEDGWDGEGSSRPDDANIAAALRWAEAAAPHLPEPAHVAPGSAGEVLFYWLAGESRMEAEFATPREAMLMITCPGKKAIHCRQPLTYDLAS